MSLVNKTTDELSLMQDEKHKEVLQSEHNRDVIEQEILDFRSNIAKIRIRMHDLEIGLIKAKEVVRNRKTEEECIKRAYWDSKRL